MSYTLQEAREALVDDLRPVVERLASALACLTEAYEAMDDQSADRLEEELFGPVRSAYGRTRRALGDFTARHGLPAPDIGQPASSGPHSADSRIYLQRGIDATSHAEAAIAELQDSMLPVEAGDRELRTDLSEIRGLLAPVPARAQQLLRTLGR